jgi:hypothetical protein
MRFPASTNPYKRDIRVTQNKKFDLDIKANTDNLHCIEESLNAVEGKVRFGL